MCGNTQFRLALCYVKGFQFQPTNAGLKGVLKHKPAMYKLLVFLKMCGRGGCLPVAVVVVVLLVVEAAVLEGLVPFLVPVTNSI